MKSSATMTRNGAFPALSLSLLPTSARPTMRFPMTTVDGAILPWSTLISRSPFSSTLPNSGQASFQFNTEGLWFQLYLLDLAFFFEFLDMGFELASVS